MRYLAQIKAINIKRPNIIVSSIFMGDCSKICMTCRIFSTKF